VIRALQTSDEAFNLTMELAKKLGKTPVAVNDAPGFVSNRSSCRSSTKPPIA